VKTDGLVGDLAVINEFVNDLLILERLIKENPG